MTDAGRKALAEALVLALPLSGHGDHDINVAIAVGVLAQHETAQNGTQACLDSLIADVQQEMGERFREIVDEASGDISVNTAFKIALRAERDAAEVRCARLEQQIEAQVAFDDAELLQVQRERDEEALHCRTYEAELLELQASHDRLCTALEEKSKHLFEGCAEARQQFKNLPWFVPQAVGDMLMVVVEAIEDHARQLTALARPAEGPR